jgi:hypothetical protein
MKKTDKKRLLALALLLIMCIVALPACKQRQPKTNKWFYIGRTEPEYAGGVDAPWDELAEEYPILKYVPHMMEVIDFYKPNGKGIKFGYLEVADPEAKYKELKTLLENDGFKQDTEYKSYPDNRSRGTDQDKEQATAVKFVKELEDNPDKLQQVVVYIEYYELRFKNSRNVFVWINIR